MSFGKKFITGIACLTVFGLCTNVNAADPSSSTMQLTCPYWDGTFDAGGYSDVVNWDISPYHPHPHHELLSGEWGAAIFYDGIGSEPNAMWLTDFFKAPYWTTNSNFGIESYCDAWDDPQNPVEGYDTGLSVIKNSEVEVTIDYEIADLGENLFSPLAYREPNSTVRVKRSERYVLLQTYTIKNIKPSGNLTGLEFYQLIHGHGADDYGPVVHCCYETFEHPDALENYTPYNSVHAIGNFKYDITQWNNPDDPLAKPHTSPHTDWVGFSCTVEPNVYECGYFPFQGDYTKPETGTHISIEERNLDSNDYSYGETAGATGWYLTDLAPDESASITVAFMFGTLNWPIPTILTKTNADPNNDCVYPWNMVDENYLTFEVCYDANGYALDDAKLIDYLPIEVDFNSCTGGGVYDSNDCTITWDLGDVGENDSNCFEVVTAVNYYARPGGVITNHVVLDSEHIYYTQASCDVNVCPYGGEIIYVDADAAGFNNGTDWNDAYTDLRDAFTGARNCGTLVTAIWVAAGTYKPIYDMGEDDTYKDATFELIEDIGLFGHFGGVGTYETNTSQRNFADANNETVLDGKIGTSALEAVKYVVKAENVEDGFIDGFTIKNSYYGAGIYLNNSNIAIANCKIKNNNSYGIQAENYSYTDIHNCLFMGNSSQNINADTGCWPIVSYCTFDGNDTTSQGINFSSYTNLDVDNSVFKDHTSNGINGSGGELTVTSSQFESNNGSGIWAGDCDLTIDHIVVDSSTNNGIYTETGCSITLEDSIIRHSGGHGISLNNNTGTTILNSWIHNNGSSGLYSSNHTVNTLLVRNNTIYDNGTYGIECSEYGADPNISNCIISGNDSNDLYRVNGSFNKVNYCLLQNNHAGTGNITGDPGFMNIDIDADDLHLDETSQCKDAGDPNGNYGDETDIDGESRIKYGRVDIGADEYYWSSADIDEDGFVNFIDYATFAHSWQTDSGDGNYDEDCDLEDNNSIDFNDLALFCEDWLWQAAWPAKEILLATDFESGIPCSWTVVDGYNDDKTWTTSNPGSRSSEYWTGNFCIVDSDKAGYVDMNESLITPAIDCSGTVEVTLEFSHYFQYYSGGNEEKCDVDISINDGPWQTVLQYTGASTGGNITEDISALAADQSNVRIRWHYYDAYYDYYWGIDNVKVIGNYRASSTQMSMGDGGGSSLKSMCLGLESTTLSSESLSLDAAATKEATITDALMLSAAGSLRTRPERLAAKSQKFYDITPETTVSAKQKTLENRKVNIKEIYKWLVELWLDPEVQEVITEDEWLKFVESVKSELE